MWILALTCGTALLVSTTGMDAAESCQVDGTATGVSKELPILDDDMGILLWFKAESPGTVTVEFFRTNFNKKYSFDIAEHKTKTWMKYYTKYTNSGLQYKADGADFFGKLLEKYYKSSGVKKYHSDFSLRLSSNNVVIWSTCDIEKRNVTRDTTTTTVPAPIPTRVPTPVSTPVICTTPTPTKSEIGDSHGVDQEAEEKLFLHILLYCIGGASVILLVIIIAMAVRLCKMARERVTLRAQQSATYSAPQRNVDSGAIYEEIDEALFTKAIRQNNDSHSTTKAEDATSRESVNSLYGVLSS